MLRFGDDDGINFNEGNEGNEGIDEDGGIEPSGAGSLCRHALGLKTTSNASELVLASVGVDGMPERALL